MDILGDLGGTHFRLATSAAPNDIYKYAIADYASADQAFDDFLNRAGLPGAKIDVFYLASAVAPRDGVIEDTRFGASPAGWRLMLQAWQHKYTIGRMVVLNDLEAACHALGDTQELDLPLICGGKSAAANPHKILVGVGTGIGHAFRLCPPAGSGTPFVHKTHGGHIAAMAPSREWMAWIDSYPARQMLNRDVIWEDFVSGTGLKNIYRLIHGLDPFADVETDRMMKDVPTVRAYCEGLGHYCHLLVAAMGMYGGLYLYGGVMDALWVSGRFDAESFGKGFLRNMRPLVRADLESGGVFYAGASISAIDGLSAYRRQMLS
jgi:glucokinase